MATPCLFLSFFGFEDSVDGFSDFLQGRPYQKGKT